ncbi:MAG: Holliday junction resolvase RuvX [Alicyclobacillus herbarius]|uniref:Holliday junction resolvase RuvX n=1 Tax=Alicyclobacillus herbarius TaxID=122960 RepID=UPI000688E1E8|nr:Holliday junction resolvase RuvX [Alicyclobacillus herbarius]MCL6631049.1 Holliday junction resolvase RuvX [Alicyclobacillus herbarius]
MRALGIDYGRARIGVAVSDPTGLLAQGLTVLERKSDDEAAEAIARLVLEYGAEMVVVGLPRKTDGTLGERAEACQAFAKRLANRLDTPVELYDERFTTVAAERMLIDAHVRRDKRRKVVDKLAAAVMLQGWLDRHRGPAGPHGRMAEDRSE